MGKRDRDRNQQWRPKVTENADKAVSEPIPGAPSQTLSGDSNPLESTPMEAQQAISGGNPPATPPPSPNSTDLTHFVANLSPEQLENVRLLASRAGIATGPQKGPNGGLLITVEIPPEAVEPLQTWAQESGSSFQEFVSKVAGDAIVNYCFGDWSAVRETPVAATTTTTTTTAGA